MIAPRIEVDLAKIRHNTRYLVDRLTSRGISVTAVTKAVCGHPGIAQAMLGGGAVELGESRLRNVERLRQAGITAPIALIRTPMASQADQVVLCCDTSYNTEIEVIARLGAAARRNGSVHNIVLMVEMGDMRDGILPENLQGVAAQVRAMPGVALTGIGANYACLGGAVPDAAGMAGFSALARKTAAACGPCMDTVSGGNSANLPWALGPGPKGIINNLRLGEAILLGVEPVSGQQIDGLHTDAFTLIAEVIEAKVKTAPTAISLAKPGPPAMRPAPDQVQPVRSIIAIGKQDTDISGLALPEGITGLGATSDHMVVQATAARLHVGGEVKFLMNYSALMRAMAAPDIAAVMVGDIPPRERDTASCDGPRLALA